MSENWTPSLVEPHSGTGQLKSEIQVGIVLGTSQSALSLRVQHRQTLSWNSNCDLLGSFSYTVLTVSPGACLISWGSTALGMVEGTLQKRGRGYATVNRHLIESTKDMYSLCQWITHGWIFSMQGHHERGWRLFVDHSVLVRGRLG